MRRRPLRVQALVLAGLLGALLLWAGQAGWRLVREALVRTVPVQASVVERRLPVEAWVLRREWVLTAGASGYLVPLAQGGQHVPKGAVVAEVVDRVERAALSQELEVLAQELARTDEALRAQSQAEAAFRREREEQEAALESQIAFAASFGRQAELESLLQLRSRLQAWAAEQEEALAAQRVALEAEKERLEERQRAVLRRLQSATDVIQAPEAGRFDLWVDGLEERLQPGRVEELTPRAVRALDSRTRRFAAGDRVVAGQPVGRLVDSHQVWLYLFLPSGHGLAEGRRLLFQPEGGPPVAGRVGRVVFFGEETGLLIELEAVPEAALTQRKVRGALILDRWEGAVVPVSALVAREGATGGLVEVARRLGVGVVATNNVHYHVRERHRLQDVLVAIKHRTTLDASHRLRRPNSEYYLKSPQEMARAFGHIDGALANTVAIAERCQVVLERQGYQIPRFAEGEDAGRRLREEALRGATERFGDPLPEPVRERLEHELDIIQRMGFADYFLIVWDLVRFARSRGIAVGPGRGSAASSLVAYALRITDVDPLAHGLLFERFLNPERVTMPDIDIDFCFVRRPEVLEYAARRFGEDRVAQIGTFGTLAARAAVRDVGRVLGLPYGDVDRVAKLIPPGLSLGEAVEREPALARLMEEDPQAKALIDAGLKVEGKPRHLSVHAAGIVIAPVPLADGVPLCRPPDGPVIPQYSGEDLEAPGCLTMGLAGSRRLPG
ncbi:MAG: hypothetical protein CW349_01250, partial [Firmicutes bacterium]|nr:hypothetical protein [Bacillota bacterium]